MAIKARLAATALGSTLALISSAWATQQDSARQQDSASPLDFATLARNHDIIDLTHTLDKDFPFIPVPGVTFAFSLEPIATIERNGVAANAWKIHEHIGTQIDAPSHFAAGGHGMQALTAEQLIVPLVVIDFRREGAVNRDAALQVDHLKAWEGKHGRIPKGAVVALYTGWDRRIGDASYIGLDEKHVKHFPGFSAEAVTFLVKERDIWGVAVDTLSFDPGLDDTYAAHRALLGAGKWALEALANLRRLPPTGATAFIGAPKVRDATGGLARVIALVPKPPRSAGRLDGGQLDGDQLDGGQLEGVWRSVAVEEIEAGGGRSTYLTRDFTFAGDRWAVEFTIYADAQGRMPVLRGSNGGRFSVGQALRLADAFEADFSFDSRTLTPLHETTAAALTAARCGAEPWRVGQPQEVTLQGCPAFRVPAASQCPREFDILQFESGRLYLGARPATGDLCSAARRPDFAGQAALERVR